MNDQDKLNFKEKYQNNPVAFIEDMCPNIKLHEYQKALLNLIHSNKYKTISFSNARMNQKKWLENMRLEYMKAMKMNFQVWSPKGIDVYEGSILVKTVKSKKGDNK